MKPESSAPTFLTYFFASICCLSLVTCFTRFDYNLPLFGFLFWKFGSVPFDRRWRQTRYVMALILLSILQDIFYILYWQPKIFSEEWTKYTRPIARLNTITTTLVWLIATIKVVVFTALFFPNCPLMLCLRRDPDVYEEYEVIKYHKLPPSRA
eukprot:Protomagalhaensia_sp_Gyna_25__3513@NODE_315_length_3910_cov_39_766210_g246_i0_p3_GENE_NODE_315_length_3910_cov_39_766210_g246_i0NODE_315_length_3910_cov_39_766210_g246_i0_p3_ORF_typecomplete_len153_score13_94Ninjurin/PF04923_12/1e04Ninjurin/PF04923_12/0_021NnrU/PF07298_11/32NnrU/PF07298_11/0_084Acyltransferase/PF01553_21/0_17SUR7/PF06687_12/1_4e03SUR7/PF06687_12/0_16AGTRAP/PF06396_11/0_26AGTRAP/PF06396_11/2e03_NODE_315_length_3910_cov_39_766210_g246_i014991957